MLEIETMAQPEEAEENDTPTDSPTESNGEEENPSQKGDGIETINTSDEDDNIPFHKHPRWIARNRELEEMRGELESLRSLKTEIESIKQPPQVEPEMPDWWKEAFGETDESKKAYQKQLEHEQKLYSQWEEKVIQKVRSSEAEEAARHEQAVRKYETQIENELDTLYEKGYKFDRNELLKVVEDYSKDAQGNFTGTLFPFEKAYEILQLKKSIPSETSKVRNQAAGKSVRGTHSGVPTKTVPTITDIRSRGWGAWRDND